MLRRLVVCFRGTKYPPEITTHTYQITLIIIMARIIYILDAKGVNASISKGQFISDGLNENAKYVPHPTDTQWYGANPKHLYVQYMRK